MGYKVRIVSEREHEIDGATNDDAVIFAGKLVNRLGSTLHPDDKVVIVRPDGMTVDLGAHNSVGAFQRKAAQ